MGFSKNWGSILVILGAYSGAPDFWKRPSGSSSRRLESWPQQAVRTGTLMASCVVM